MHEMSIAQSLLEIIQDKLSENEFNSARVKVVRMRIGEMAGVMPESLRLCFEVASEGTPVQGAELNIEEVLINCRCQTCETHFGVEGYVFVCPNCGSPEVDVLTGNELHIIELEVDERGPLTKR